MQKFTLVPFDPVFNQASYNPYFRQTLDTNEPTVHAIQSLQQDMSKLLDDPNLSNFAKATFLTQMEGRVQNNLKKYREMLGAQTQAASSSLATTSSAATGQATTTSSQATATPTAAAAGPSKTTVLQTVPKQYKRKASQLFDLLNTHPDFKLNEKSELVVGGTPIVGSNVSDLLNFTTTTKNVGNLEGITTFNKYLQEVNVPHSLLGRQATVYPPRAAAQTGSLHRASRSERRSTQHIRGSSSPSPPVLTREPQQSGSGNWSSFPSFYVKDEDLFRRDYRNAVLKRHKHFD